MSMSISSSRLTQILMRMLLKPRPLQLPLKRKLSRKRKLRKRKRNPKHQKDQVLPPWVFQVLLPLLDCLHLLRRKRSLSPSRNRNRNHVRENFKCKSRRQRSQSLVDARSLNLSHVVRSQSLFLL